MKGGKQGRKRRSATGSTGRPTKNRGGPAKSGAKPARSGHPRKDGKARPEYGGFPRERDE